MATEYFAPGVYVEEVPSAQQPISGVGTSTAAFIGVIPEKKITIPKLNESYDPVLAKRAMEETPEVRGKKLEDRKIELEKKNEELKQRKAEKDEKTQEASQPDPAPDDPEAASIKRAKRRAEKRAAELGEMVATLEKRVERLNSEIESLNRAPEPYPESAIKLCEYEEFPIEERMPALDAELCTNFSEYTQRCGGFSADDPAVESGTPLHPGHRALTHAVNGFFQNGGTKCFVVRIKNEADLEKALEIIESIDAVAIVAAPGLPATEDVWGDLGTHCANTEDRFAILDCPADVENERGELDINLLNYDTTERKIPGRNKNAAFYFPYIKVVDPAKQLQDQDPARKVEPKHQGVVYVAPSGHIAGIYSRTDEERGVHKAPANVIVRGVTGVKYYVGRPRQKLLNPQGVNCIRDLNGAITVWGARTVGGDKNGEWKYVSVRRLFLFLRESIDEGTQWVVFEPNDRKLWEKIRQNITAFLTNVWRSGALFGSSPAEAFYVKCDDETNPPEVRDVGRVVTEIGISIVRPAEFVIFRISQSSEGGKG